MSKRRAPRRWPLFLIAAPAAVAVWSGWVGLGAMCGFGVIHPLPGIWDALKLNTAITLPIGVESYGAYAMGVWLFPGLPEGVRKFAKRSAIGSLFLGMLGQVAFHLLNAAHKTQAPWEITVMVSSLPVITLGFGAGLTHLLARHHKDEDEDDSQDTPSAPERPLEELTAATVPSMSTYSTATSELLSGLPKAPADDESAEEEREQPARQPELAAARSGGGHAAPRSRSWSRDRRAKAIVSNARARGEDLTGAELGRKLGVTPRHGQRLLQSMDSI